MVCVKQMSERLPLLCILPWRQEMFNVSAKRV